MCGFVTPKTSPFILQWQGITLLTLAKHVECLFTFTWMHLITGSIRFQPLTVSQIVQSYDFPFCHDTPQITITAAAAAAAADVLAIGCSSGMMYLFDRSDHNCESVHYTVSNSHHLLTLSSFYLLRLTLVDSESLVCLHKSQELDASVTGIVLSRDGCEMGVSVGALADCVVVFCSNSVYCRAHHPYRSSQAPAIVSLCKPRKS